MKRTLGVMLVVVVLLAVGSPVAAQSPTWTCHGPYGGRVLAMAISPQYASDGTVFAGTEQGGLFRSLDRGVVWQAVKGLPSDLTISSIVLSPGFATDRTVLVSSTQGGIFQSWDAGATWRWWSDGLASLSVAQMAISPRYGADQTLVAATDQGLYLSTTAGKVWIAVGPRMGTLAAAMAPTASGQPVAFGGTVIGLYVSTNGGTAWNPTLLSSAPVVSIAVSPDFIHDFDVLVGTLAGAYFSPDGGATWQGPFMTESAAYQVLFSATYAADHTWFVGNDRGGYRSQDGGQNWSALSAIPETVRCLVTSAAPAHLYAGLDSQGVFASRDAGASWASATQGITSVPVNTVAASPAYATDGTLFAGGPGGVWRSRDDAQSWEATTLDYASVVDLAVASDYATSRQLFAASDGGMFISLSAGRRWFPAQGDLPVLSVRDLALDAEGRLWAATAEAGVFTTLDGGAHWESRSSGLGSQNVAAVEYLGQGEGGARLVAATWDKGIYLSTNGGLTWVAAQRGPQSPFIHGLAATLGYSNLLWTFAATSTGVYRSADLGLTWDDAGLFGLELSGIALHPRYVERPNCYASSTQGGVYLSLNGGLTWQSLNLGLGNLHVNDVTTAPGPSDSALFASTRGGVWRYGGVPIATTPPSEVDLLLPIVYQRAEAQRLTTLESAAPLMATEDLPQRNDR